MLEAAVGRGRGKWVVKRMFLYMLYRAESLIDLGSSGPVG